MKAIERWTNDPAARTAADVAEEVDGVLAGVEDVGVEVHVHGPGRQRPEPRKARPTDRNGRGLALVEALASRWGTERTDAGAVRSSTR